MTSTLHLGVHQESLAGRLATLLDEAEQTGDFFAPTSMVVPNRYLGKWLRLELARLRGVAINLRVEYLLEKVLWQLLQECDGRADPLPLEQLTDEHYRLMILLLLMDEDLPAPSLAPLRSYLSRPGGSPARRDSWR
ncbi:MAG TPA: exodeoxyribonuclease V subunit gamma, partial [Gemmataceae bacterium]|nr:exodeoxyribonuclease V subunit gamma [Gemmataceae bacterium]